MNSQKRAEFHSLFSQTKYEQLVRDLNADFRICESPVFLTPLVRSQLEEASQNILSQLQEPGFLQSAERAVPKDQWVPQRDDHPHFLQFDFALTDSGPRLIELQGFVSLYAYQILLDRKLRDLELVPSGLTAFFSGLNSHSAQALLSRAILGDQSPQETILLEYKPDQQRTRVDFHATKELVGIETVCLTEIRKRGTDLYYIRDGREQSIKRIFNRLIFDDLVAKGAITEFWPTDAVNVDWAGHPNWFHMISKHTLPMLKGEFVPWCSTLADLKEMPSNLDDFVLKPLFSFAGTGVKLRPTIEEIEALGPRSDWILQQKVHYAPFLEGSKAELRVMVIWIEEPILVTTLVRASRGELLSAGANMSERMTGATLAYF